MRRVLCAAAAMPLLACSTFGGDSASRSEPDPEPVRRLARNVILFVGDGMGVSTVTAARILEGQLRGESGEENALAFESFPHVALSKTYNTNQQVPDSAGTMTAMVTGTKTRAGLLSVGPAVARRDHRAADASRLLTILEEAEERGLATGVVTTARVTHATPAACYAHSPERDWESDAKLAELSPSAAEDGFPDIARQLIEFSAGDGLEVALGGGRAAFLPKEVTDPEELGVTGVRSDGRDLTREWLDRFESAAYVWSAEQLAALVPGETRHLLGLFDPSHMEWENDRARDTGGEPSLAEMTTSALSILSESESGFFLMVEGGRIDHGHHASNAYRALTDTIAFSDAVRSALERVDLEETLVLVTADHSHTLTISGYPTRGNPILGLVHGNDEQGSPKAEPATDDLGLPYTTLSYANGPGYSGASSLQAEGAKQFPHYYREDEDAKQKTGIKSGRPKLGHEQARAAGFLQESTWPLNSETHGGEDVVIYATGPGAERVHGVQEQTIVYEVMKAALGWSAPEAQQ